MSAVAIGPFVFALSRLAALAALAVFLLATELIERRTGRKLGRWPMLVMLGWLLAARLGYVAGEWPAFAAAPLDMLKLWQGGFSPWAGAIGAGLVLAVAAWRRRVLLGPLLLAAALAALAGGLTLQLRPGAGSVERLTPISLTDLAGQPVPLDARAGRPLVLNLWASWCPPCARELPMMQEVAAASPGVDVVFANQGETAARIASFLDRAGLVPAGILRDPDRELMSRYGAIGLPATLFFRADGSLVHGAVGEISRAELMRRIDEIRPAAAQ